MKADCLVDFQSGSVCRTFDIIRGMAMLGWVYRIYYCHKHFINKYRHQLWRMSVVSWMPILGLYDIFLTPCQEDMRVNYNYYLYKPPPLQEIPGAFQKIENVARKHSDAGQKLIIPEELRGEGRGRYVNTENFTTDM